MRVRIKHLGFIGRDISEFKEPWKFADLYTVMGDRMYAHLYVGDPEHPAYIRRQFIDRDYHEDGVYDLPIENNPAWRIPE